MKWTFTIRIFLMGWICLCSSLLFAQQPVPPSAPKPWPMPDTPMVPMPLQPVYNAGFDVIITTDGNIIYGLVKEVDELFIKYKRTDIPDGPIYTIRKSEVYAISYRNQVKEFITPVNKNRYLPGRRYYDSLDIQMPLDVNLNPSIRHDKDYVQPYKYTVKNKTHFRLGVGFIRGYTKVKDASDFKSKASFPDVSISYDKYYNKNLNVGVMLTFGSNKFSADRFSSYDSTSISSDIKESVFSLMVYGKYAVGNNFSNLKPYVLGGIGINSSSVDTENQISFTNNSQVVKVNSGGRSVGIGIIARVGADYFFNPQYGVYADVGVGPSVVQVGAIINIQ